MRAKVAGERGKEARAAQSLLAWYDRERRVLPWRAAPGVVPDPYRVWLSEIMLQQTTVKAVLPRYADFLRRWPDVGSLAQRRAWRGARRPGPGLAITRAPATCMPAPARWSSASAAASPRTEAELRTLPGVGGYTAAAIAAIAFGASAHAGRRQYRACGRAALRRDRAAPSRQAGDQGARRNPDARGAGGRLRAKP